jgi:RNA polymerase sigma-70 factor (ECF subfamily)
VTGRRADAEDATQEVFLAVHAALPRFRGEPRLSTWVYRIALRAALRVRAGRRDGEPFDAGIPAGGGEGEVAWRDEARRVAAALGRLPAEHRLVLSLFGVEALTHGEAAEVLGVPEGTAWSRLHAARRALAAALGGGPGGGS